MYMYLLCISTSENLPIPLYVLVISQCEYNILVIAQVQGGAEDECNNQDIV